MARLLAVGRRLRSSEDAATTAEYVLMAMLVAVACVAAVTSLSLALKGEFQKAVDSFR